MNVAQILKKNTHSNSMSYILRFFAFLKIFILLILSYFMLSNNLIVANQISLDNGLILIADQIKFDTDKDALETMGNVKIFYDGKIVTAGAVTYSKNNKQLLIRGPIKIKFDNNIVTIATSAELSDDLKEGIIFAANTLIDNAYQVRSEKVKRLTSGSSEFYNAITSSCQVCSNQAYPIWDISAKKIVHNKAAKELIFTNARFSIMGFPIFYTPYLKTPEPGVDRASGFLTPSTIFSSSTGFGYKQPYYQILSPHSDITSSFLVSEIGLGGIDLEYRQQFHSSDLNLFFEFDAKENSRKFFKTSKIIFNSSKNDFKTSLSMLGFFVPNTVGQKTESYFRINTSTKFDENTTLTTDIINNTDRDLLSSYSYSSVDRVVSNIKLTTVKPKSFREGKISLFTSFRDEDVASTEPQALPEVFWRSYKRAPSKIGGSYGMEVSLMNLVRSEGRDVLRVSTGLDFQKETVFQPGIKANNIIYLRTSAYKIRDDNNFLGNNVFSVQPLISSDITLPLVYKSSNFQNILIPRLQFIYSEATNIDRIPNEDSLNVNFDETNIFSHNRSPGIDHPETGLRLNAGIEFHSNVNKTFSYAFSIGEIFRFKPNRQFSSSSGVDGYRSDIVLSAKASLRQNFPNIDLSSKLLMDQNMALKLNETSLIWSEENYTNTGSFVYLVKDAEENRFKDQAYLNFGTNFNIGTRWNTELSLNRDFINNYFSDFKFQTKYILNRNWTGTLLAKKSFSEASIVDSESGIKLSYQNECLKLDVSYMEYLNKPETKDEFSISFSTPLFTFGSGSTSSAPGLSFEKHNFNQSSSVCAMVR